jgi:hypothetical protein
VTGRVRIHLRPIGRGVAHAEALRRLASAA